MERKPVILAVDDESNVLKLLSINFTLEGYDVITAGDGPSGIALFFEYQPDLVLLDIMMPDLSGFEVVEEIRQHSDTPIIMLTAKDDIHSVEKALLSGADDYITKPFNFRLLSARIKSKIARKEALQPHEIPVRV